MSDKIEKFEAVASGPFCGKKSCQDLLLASALLIILTGCVGLFTQLTPGWVETADTRHRVLVIAGFLFMAAGCLCWYIMRGQRKKIEMTELRMLIIDSPPNYETVVSNEQPPPSYITVIRDIRVA